MTIGGFQVGGSVEAGYRFTHIGGREDRYKEVVNLSEGLKLFDLNLLGKDPDSQGVVDYLSLNASGIGDPFPSGRLEIKKSKTYDLVATYKEFKYFFDREDNGFLTDNHDFSQKRRRGSLSLNVLPKEDVQVIFGYSYSARDGNATVPRYPFLLNLDQDLKEQLNEVFLGANFRLGNWDLHVKQSFWSYENKNEIREPAQLVEKRDERVNTSVSTIKGHTRLGERWDLDAAYIYARSDGRADLKSVPEFPTTSSGRGTFDANTHIAEIGLSYLLRRDLIMHLDSRFHSVNQEGNSDTDPDVSRSDYNSMAYTGTAQLEYSPQDNLSLKGGYRFQYRHVHGENFDPNRFDGGSDPAKTNTIGHGWIGSVNWRPYKFLSLYGEYQGATFENPYTWISPQSENLAKVKVKYDTPLKNLNLIGTFLWKRRVNPDQEYRVDIQDYILAATYQPDFLPKLTLDASFTYESIKDKKNIVNATPTPSYIPFTLDSDAYIYSGGFSYDIYKGLGVRANGSFARTTGENSQRFTDGTLSVWYKTKWVTPIVTLEGIRLVDHVVPDNGFNATLVTFSLRKEF